MRYYWPVNPPHLFPRPRNGRRSFFWFGRIGLFTGMLIAVFVLAIVSAWMLWATAVAVYWAAIGVFNLGVLIRNTIRHDDDRPVLPPMPAYPPQAQFSDRR